MGFNNKVELLVLQHRAYMLAAFVGQICVESAALLLCFRFFSVESATFFFKSYLWTVVGGMIVIVLRHLRQKREFLDPHHAIDEVALRYFKQICDRIGLRGTPRFGLHSQKWHPSALYFIEGSIVSLPENYLEQYGTQERLIAVICHELGHACDRFIRILQFGELMIPFAVMSLSLTIIEKLQLRNLTHFSYWVLVPLALLLALMYFGRFFLLMKYHRELEYVADLRGAKYLNSTWPMLRYLESVNHDSHNSWISRLASTHPTAQQLINNLRKLNSTKTP